MKLEKQSGAVPGDQDLEISQWLDAMRGGDEQASKRLTDVLYRRLYRLASQASVVLDPAPSLNPTAIVNEVFIKMIKGKTLERAENRVYLYVAAARAMREVLADYYVKRSAEKRKPRGERVALDEMVDYFAKQEIDLDSLREALKELEKCEPRKAAVVQAKYFMGDTMREAADRLGISLSTAESDLRTAKIWLFRRLNPQG